jgi:hypothetical protein
MRRINLWGVAFALAAAALSTSTGCRSSEPGELAVASGPQAGERASAFRDIGKRSASDDLKLP